MPEDERVTEPKPINYSIPRDQFVLEGTNVTAPQKYRFPQRVTRDNFVEFLRGSFAISRGKQSALWVQFEWLKRKENFDYGKTFSNFFAAGGSATLGFEELKNFREDYFRIPDHDGNPDRDPFVRRSIEYFGLTKEKAEDQWVRATIENSLTYHLTAAGSSEKRSEYLNDFPDDVIDVCNTSQELFDVIDRYIRNKDDSPNV